MKSQFDLTGQKFGKLTVLCFIESNKNNGYVWECLCECGNKTNVIASRLRKGRTKSCSCIQKEFASSLAKDKIKHGETIGGKQSSEYHTWNGIKERCNNINCERYPDYGGRGIEVCPRWMDKEHGFANFLADMGRRPSIDYTLDRFPNNDGNYSPENCRWATDLEQCRNRRSNVWIEHDGKRMVMKDWSNEMEVDNRLVHRMLKTKPFHEVYEYYMNKKKAS